MAQENKPFEDEEYQFSDSDVSEDFSVLEEEPYQPAANRWRRIAIVLVVLFIVIIGVYQLLDYFFAPQEMQPALSLNTPDFSQPISAPVATPTPAPRSPGPTPVPSTTTSTSPNEVNQGLALLRTESANTKSELIRVSSTVGHLQSTMNEINTNINKLNYTLEKMSKELSQQKAELAVVKRLALNLQQQQEVVVDDEMPVARREIYYVQAIIPGRAWIRSDQGNTMTISKGSRIPGYGAVVLIDHLQGEIQTSSNRLITYSPNEA